MHFVYGYLVVNVPVQKEKNVKKNDVRCKKSVKCVFFAVPKGNSCFLYNILQKKWIEINKMRKLVRTMRVF